MSNNFQGKHYKEEPALMLKRNVEVVDSLKGKNEFLKFVGFTKVGASKSHPKLYKNSKYFEDDIPIKFLKVQADLDEIKVHNTLKSVTNQSSMIKLLLQGKGATIYKISMKDQSKNGMTLMNQVVKDRLNAVAMAVFPHWTLMIQKH